MPAHLIPADLAHSMDPLAEHIRAGGFEAVLARLADAGDARPGSIRERIAGAVRSGGGEPHGEGPFAARAGAVAAALDRLDAQARAVAVFLLLPCAGDCAPRDATESDFAFAVRLFGSHDLVWRVAGGELPSQLPGLEAMLNVRADPLAAARRYLDAVPRAASWLGWHFAAGPHPDAVRPATWLERLLGHLATRPAARDPVAA